MPTLTLLEPYAKKQVDQLRFRATESTIALDLRELSLTTEPAYTARYVNSDEPASFVVSEQVDQRVEIGFEDGDVTPQDPVVITVTG